MNRSRYTVERNGQSATVDRIGWSAAAVVAMRAREKLMSWEVVKEDNPYTLFEVTGSHDGGYILANGDIKVYIHKA